MHPNLPDKKYIKNWFGGGQTFNLNICTQLKIEYPQDCVALSSYPLLPFIKPDLTRKLAVKHSFTECCVYHCHLFTATIEI